MTHKAMKFRVKNPEHSKAIQERLFEMGYKWLSSGCNINHTERKALYAEVNGLISFGTSTDFRNDGYQETTLEEITEWTPKQGEIIEAKDFHEKEWSTVEFIGMHGCKFVAIDEVKNTGYLNYNQARPINPIRREIEELKAKLNELEAKL